MIQVTDLALEKIQEILQVEPPSTVIRVNVTPGWGGFKIRLALDESRDHDKMIEVRGVKFVLDNYSAMFVEECLVDYDDYEDDFIVTDLNGPNSSC